MPTAFGYLLVPQPTSRILFSPPTVFTASDGIGRISSLTSNRTQDDDLGVLARAVEKGVRFGFDLAFRERAIDLGAHLFQRRHYRSRIMGLEAYHVDLRIIAGFLLRRDDGEGAKTKVQIIFDDQAAAHDLLELLVVHRLE